MKQTAKTLAFALSLLPAVGYGQTSDTNIGSATSSMTTQKVEGAVTNNVQGTLTIEWPEGQPMKAEAMVEVVEVEDLATNAGPIVYKDYVAETLDHVKHNDWWYFKATNDFCGPVELRDSTGQKVKLLRPEVSSNEAYPSSYKLDGAQQRYMRRYRIAYSAPHVTYPEWEQPELARFKLFDYFEITNSGDYRLTVWPKVYVRTSTNTFDCKLIDVPPVTATFTFRR